MQGQVKAELLIQLRRILAHTFWITVQGADSQRGRADTNPTGCWRRVQGRRMPCVFIFIASVQFLYLLRGRLLSARQPPL